jgi:hypothetical protein
VGARCSVQNKDSVLGGCLVAIDETFDASANLICLFLSLHLSAWSWREGVGLSAKQLLSLLRVHAAYGPFCSFSWICKNLQRWFCVQLILMKVWFIRRSVLFSMTVKFSWIVQLKMFLALYLCNVGRCFLVSDGSWLFQFANAFHCSIIACSLWNGLWQRGTANFCALYLASRKKSEISSKVTCTWFPSQTKMKWNKRAFFVLLDYWLWWAFLADRNC